MSIQLYRQSFKFDTNVDSGFKQYVIIAVTYNGLEYLIAEYVDDRSQLPITRAKERFFIDRNDRFFKDCTYYAGLVMTANEPSRAYQNLS